MGIWLIYALLSAASAALVAVLGKIGLKDIDANASTAVRSIIMAAFMLGVIIVQGKWGQFGEIWTTHRRPLAFIALSGISGALSWMFYFLALKYGKVAQVGPVDKLSVVIAVLLAASFLGEKITWLNGIGVVLITAGVILTAIK